MGQYTSVLGTTLTTAGLGQIKKVLTMTHMWGFNILKEHIKKQDGKQVKAEKKYLVNINHYTVWQSIKLIFFLVNLAIIPLNIHGVYNVLHW